MSNEVDLCDQVEVNGTVTKEIGGTSFAISHASKPNNKPHHEISNRRNVETYKKTNQTHQATRLTNRRNKTPSTTTTTVENRKPIVLKSKHYTQNKELTITNE